MTVYSQLGVNRISAATGAVVAIDGLALRGPVYDVRHPDFGAVGDGVADDGPAFSRAEAARALTGGVVYVPPAPVAYKIATQVVSTTAAGRVNWVFEPGAIVHCYVPDAIKWVSTASIAGLLVENGEFHNYHGVAKRACIRVTVTGAGAWERVRMPGLRIHGRNAFVRGEGIWIESVFEGEIDLWTESGPELAMRVNALALNSGNLTTRVVANFSAITCWLNYGDGNTLLNNVRFPNFKAVSEGTSTVYAETTATGAHAPGVVTLQVASTAGMGNNHYLVIGGKQYVRTAGAGAVVDATHIALADPLEFALAGGEHVVDSSFGLVAGANVEVAPLHSAHFEGVGVGIYAHGAKLVRASGAMLGANVKRGLVAHAQSLACELSDARFVIDDNNLTVIRTADAGTQFNGLTDYVGVTGGSGGTTTLISDAVGDNTNFVRRAAAEFGANVVLNAIAFGFAWRDGGGALRFLATTDGTHTHIRSYAAGGGVQVRFDDAAGNTRAAVDTSDGSYSIGANTVLKARIAGWADPTGTLSRATFDQSTVTLAQLAQRVAQLILDLKTHGLIGT